MRVRPVKSAKRINTRPDEHCLEKGEGFGASHAAVEVQCVGQSWVKKLLEKPEEFWEYR